MVVRSFFYPYALISCPFLEEKLPPFVNQYAWLFSKWGAVALFYSRTLATDPVRKEERKNGPTSWR